MTILVDVEERRSSVPALLKAMGVRVEMTVLHAGDYVFGGATIERKTVDDLHRSIASGRLWTQVASLPRGSRRSYLLIEGMDLDVGPLSRHGIRGAVLQAIDNGVAVIRTVDAADSALWLRLLAVRRGRGGVGRGRRGRRRSTVTGSGLLAAVPGISPTLADRLVARFGSVAGVAAASTSDLLEIDGIGPERTKALRAVLLGTSLRSEEVP